MTSRQVQSEETKQKIFLATMRLLENRDADDIKITDIIKEAQVSVGSFYNHYSSKNDVFAESYQLEDKYFEEEVEPALIQDDVRERLLFFFNRYAFYNSEIASIGKLRYVLSCNCIHVERPYETGTLGVLQRVIQWGINNGQLQVDENSVHMVHFMMVSARGLIDNWYTRNKIFNLQDEMKSFVQKFIRLFCTESDSVNITPPHTQ
ncbi:MAG: TetR/AcrR family transcriptional regulator [Clostridiales bacterium]|nr:TetR/AcrR family transcriptional regulator [Clostridiales bacterium]